MTSTKCRSDVWITIEDFPDYSINEYGDVKRITKGGNNFCKVGRILKARKEKNGYIRLNLYREGEIKRMSIHRLVAFAFIGDQPSSLHEVAHNDGTRHNNHFSNLRWCTRKDNHADKKIHGTQQHGSNNPNSKLTEEDVLNIRTSNMKNIDLAKKYKVHHQTISNIKKFIGWNHVK